METEINKPRRYSVENQENLQKEIKSRAIQFHFYCKCCGKRFRVVSQSNDMCGDCISKSKNYNTSTYEFNSHEFGDNVHFPPIVDEP